ncbi:Defective in germ line development protein [Dirofilaria immitis]
MCDCAPSSSMPFAGQWVLRGGFTPRVSPRCPNTYFPHQENIFRQSRDEFFVSFYHRSQESAKIFDAMKRRVELAYEQRRKSEANRLQKAINGNVRHLERIPLSKNVTLTIEIPSTEHACMIERMEAWCDEDSIPQIMQDTGVLIQFPDLMPEVKNARDYVNKVTLTGPLANVEQARIRIRNFTPIAISFPLRTLKPNILIKDVKNIIDKAIAEKLIDFPNLEIMVQSSQLPKDSIPSCVVRGTPSHERDICDACAVLHRLLFDAANDSEHSSAMIYSTVMDIPLVQQLAVTGVPDGYLIRMISLETNAIIYFPTISDHRFGATVFYLYGSVHAIMRARKYIQGLLPVRLIFDVENNDLLYPVDASDRELFLRDTEHDLTIIMKKSSLEGEKITANDTLRNMVIIESGEYNLTNVYAMRHQLLRKRILEDEPLIVTKDFDFLDRDFKELIARNNQVIVESVCSNDSQAKISSLRYSRLNQNRESSSLPAMPVISSSILNDVVELLPQIHVSQEILQLSESENIPFAVTIDGQEETGKEAVIFSTSPSLIIAKQQYASDEINVSVPQFLDLFKQNENKSVTMIPVDDAGKSLSKLTIPQKVEYIRSINKIAADKSADEHLDGYNFDIANNNAACSLTSKTKPGTVAESKYLSEKSPLYAQLFTVVPQSQDLIDSGVNVVEDQESAQNSRANSPEKIWQTRKNLPLKSSFTNENYIREYQYYVGANATVPQEISAREPREALSDVRFSSFSNHNDILYSISRSNPAQNSSQHRLLHSNKNNSDNTYDYRKERQSARTRESIIWKNSRHSSSLFYAHSNTREISSKTYQRRFCQNSLRSSDMIHGGRMVKQSMKHSDGYYSTFSRFQSTWSLSSGYSEDKRYSNRAATNFHLKRQFVNRTQLKEKQKDDGQEKECFSLYQEQHGCDQFQKECEELKKNVNDVTSPSTLLVRTKTYADITKRIDVMVLIDEVQRNQNEPSLQSVQQLNRPALMMKELEKYTGIDKASSKSYADMAKKSTTEDVYSKTFAQNQVGSEHSTKVIAKDHCWMKRFQNTGS